MTVTTSLENASSSWQRVDLNENCAIEKVPIWNRSDCYSNLISGSKIENLNNMGDVVDEKSAGEVDGARYVEF